MRADRLVSMVLLLRQRGRMSAAELASALEVSTRTVLRDVEALSAAGVPVYAERGRHGGFALLPGFRTELTGLTEAEVLALLVAGSQRAQTFGLSGALTSAMLKVVDAVPGASATSAGSAAQRLLVEPDTDLLERPRGVDNVPAAVITPVREGVLAGRKLRIHYAAPDRTPAWRTVDPVGLVTARGLGYLLAVRDGEERTYRLSRIVAAEVLEEPADRAEDVDLEQMWRQRASAFRSGDDQVQVVVRLEPGRREWLVTTALTVSGENVEDTGWIVLDVTFQDARHAEWALWELGTGAEVLEPQWLRGALHERAQALVKRYAQG